MLNIIIIINYTYYRYTVVLIHGVRSKLELSIAISLLVAFEVYVVCELCCIMSTLSTSFPPPAPLKLGSDIATDWNRFKSEWENYMIVADLSEVAEKKQAAIFLASIGTAAHSVFRTFKFTDETHKQKVEKIIEAFEKYCISEANETYERFLFHQRIQQPGESFDDFLTDLRKLAATCSFATLEDSLIRDRVVIGIRDDATRRRLLATKKLSLTDAVETCKASEVTSRRLRVIGGSAEVDALNTSTRNRRSSPKRPDRKQIKNSSNNNGGHRCRYCALSSCNGSKGACRAYGQKCRACGLLNHFAKSDMCKKQKTAASTSTPRHRVVCEIDNDTDTDTDNSDELLALHNGDNKRAYCHLNVEGRSVHFLLDCGATVNVLPLEDAAGISPKLRNLRPAETRLRMFDNTELKTVGMLTARVQHPLSGKSRRMQFYVAATHNRAILGMDACLEMDLLFVNRDNICTVQEDQRQPSPAPPSKPQPSLMLSSRCGSRSRTTKRTDPTPPARPCKRLNESSPGPSSLPPSPSLAIGQQPLTKEFILETYSDVFSGVGLLPGEIHLEIDDSVPPVQMPPRRLAVPIRDIVKQELETMCRNGIIEPVTEPSAWISALLVVRKANGKVRVCLDPKPLNKALKRCHYPMPTIDDVLPQLAKAKVFSTLDATSGFWHLQLDKESRPLTTFETPFGRFRWVRLPFGISPSPEIFMAKMHETLRD